MNKTREELVLTGRHEMRCDGLDSRCLNSMKREKLKKERGSMGTGKGSQDTVRGLENLNIRLMQVPEVEGKEEGNV